MGQTPGSEVWFCAVPQTETGLKFNVTNMRELPLKKSDPVFLACL